MIRPVSPSSTRRSTIREAVDVEVGDRMLLWCEGGPSQGRATTFPPPVEVDVAGGVYVLVDDGPIEQWHYTFIEDDIHG